MSGKFKNFKSKAKEQTEFDPKSVPGFKDMERLVESGDLDPQVFLNAYKEENKEDYPKGVDWVLAICAYTDDNYPIELYVRAMEYTLKGSTPEQAVQLAIEDLPEDWKEKEEDVEDASKEVQETEEQPTAAPAQTPAKPEGKQKVLAPKLTPAEAANNRIRSQSVSLAATNAVRGFKDDPDLNAAFEEISKAPGITKRAPARVLLRLMQHTSEYDKDGRIIACAIDAWPVPGSTIKSIDPEKSNMLFDKYDYIAEDGSRVKGSYYDDLAYTFPAGVEIADEIDMIKKAIDPQMPNPSKYPSAEWSKVRLEKLKSTWDQRWRALVKSIRDAVALRHQLVSIAENCPNVIVDWNFLVDEKGRHKKDKHDNPILDESVDTFLAMNKGANIGNVEAFSVKQVLAWDVPKAAEAGGHLGALKDTAATGASIGTGKGKGGKGKNQEVKVPVFSSFDLFIQGIHSMADYSRDHELDSDMIDLKAQIAKVKGGKGADDYIEAMGHAWSLINRLFTVRDQERFAEICAERQKKAEEASKNKLERTG